MIATYLLIAFTLQMASLATSIPIHESIKDVSDRKMNSADEMNSFGPAAISNS